MKLKIHFIGIGGIGVSALAEYYLKKDCQVYGSDLCSSEITDALKKKGAKIKIGKHKKENLSNNVKLVIYSPAVKKNNPELQKARRAADVAIFSYPQALGKLTKKHYTIAVSGTHGKSTTAAMLGLLLVKAGLDPTVILGTKLKEFNNSNCRVGNSEYLVIEADEHFASFLNYWPKIIVLTSVEADHLDYYKNLKNVLSAFKKYVRRLPADGFLAANWNDKNIRKILAGDFQFAIKKYSLKQQQAKKLKKILKIPGKHNISNALAALTAARILKIQDKISFKALSEYRCSWRRFEISQAKLPGNKDKTAKKITVVSDYGHHPTEIKVTLQACREKYPKKTIWCVYQPHQHQRTYYLFKDFIKAFRTAPIDKIIITDIYDVAGREKSSIKKKINSKILAEAINKKKVLYLPDRKIMKYLKENLTGGEVVVIMGAGNIYQLTLKVQGLTKENNREKIK